MSTVRQLTLQEVSKHNTFADCWLIINQRVWDATGFMRDHPGGAAIIRMYGGKDCTQAFLDVHSEAYLLSFMPHGFVGVVAGSNAQPPANLMAMQKRAKPRADERSLLLMPRKLYSAEHEQWRLKFRQFLMANVVPKYGMWERNGCCDADVIKHMCKEGYYLRFAIPKEHGGLGISDWRYNAILAEEIESLDLSGLFLTLGNDMVLSYFTKSCTPEQRARWLPLIAREEKILAVAMSEPEVGSDLGALSTRAVKSADGQHYIVNGRKMWISMGSNCDIMVCAVMTDPTKGYHGISLLAIERGTPGFACAKTVGKLGKAASDTCLMTLKDCKVPVANLIGHEGKGFIYMMDNLAKERLIIAVSAMAAARRSLSMTVNYVHGREAFGGTIGSLQTVQHSLAAMRAEIQSATAFIDQCIESVCTNQLTADAASAAKLIATDLCNSVANRCLQLWGGYGYLKNSPIGKQFVDQRVTRIYGGANEVLLEVVAKGMGFQREKRSKL